MSIHSWSMSRRAAAETVNAPTTFQGTSKRERILRAAVDVFAKNGYFNAKVSEIAKAAGVADATIFREHTRNYLASLERDLVNVRRPEDRIRAAIHHHLEALGRDRNLAVVSQVELRDN